MFKVIAVCFCHLTVFYHYSSYGGAPRYNDYFIAVHECVSVIIKYEKKFKHLMRIRMYLEELYHECKEEWKKKVNDKEQ